MEQVSQDETRGSYHGKPHRSLTGTKGPLAITGKLMISREGGKQSSKQKCLETVVVEHTNWSYAAVLIYPGSICTTGCTQS